MNDTLSLRGKRALVTGAAGAIGSETARLFAGLGATLFLTDRDDATIEPLVRELRSSARVDCMACEVTDPTQVDRVRDVFRDAFGEADILVLAAGIYRPAPIGSMTDEQWSTMIDVNLGGPFAFCRAFIPILAEGSAIAFLSSIAGHRGSHSFGHYAASKSGLLGLARSLAVELAPRTRVNVVSPGPVDSPMVAPLMAARGADILAQSPMKRLCTPGEVAKVLAFLGSDWSSFVTGENVHVNGGLYMG